MRKKPPAKEPEAPDRLELLPKQDEGSVLLMAGLNSLVIGQNQAKQSIVDAIMQNLNSVVPRRGPLATLFFYGPSGVGKTEIAHALAQLILGNRNRLTKVKMELFSESHSVTNLIGSPKGYIGSDTPGVFGPSIYKHAKEARKDNEKNNFLARYPMFNIIVLDEIEKAHPNVHKLMLGIMDDGVITITDGTEIDFSESIIIMTSNIGSREKRNIDEKHSMGFVESDKKLDKAIVDREVMKLFVPEFWGRIDARVEFEDLTPSDCREIIDVNLARINTILATVAEQNHVTHLRLHLADPVYEFIVKNGFNRAKGARELVRIFNREINAKFGKIIVDNDQVWEFPDHEATILAELVGDRVTFVLDKSQIKRKDNVIFIPNKTK